MGEPPNELPQDRWFWVWLTIFSILFGSSPFIIWDHRGWGIFCGVTGLAGLFVLIRDRLTAAANRLPIKMLLKVLAAVVLSILVGQLLGYDIYHLHANGSPPVHFWQYVPILLIVLAVILLVVGGFTKTQVESAPIENQKQPTLAQRVLGLATRYKKAAREFHRQNPQPPAPPALTTWATKANGWQKVNFLSELQRAHDELEAEGFSDVLLDVAIASTPTLDRVEQITQRLRFLAAQLDDDPSDYQNVKLPEKKPTDAASPSWVRFLTFYPEIVPPPALGKEPAKKPQKIRCEFLNCTELSYKVKVLSWDCGSRGFSADFWRGCLQLRIGTYWCPEWNGVEELHVPPGEVFRLWVFPKDTLTDDQFKARVNLGNLGTVHLLINGKEIVVSVG